MLHTILLITAVVLFFLSAFGVNSPRVSLQSLGLAAFVLTFLI